MQRFAGLCKQTVVIVSVQHSWHHVYCLQRIISAYHLTTLWLLLLHLGSHLYAKGCRALQAVAEAELDSDLAHGLGLEVMLKQRCSMCSKPDRRRILRNHENLFCCQVVCRSPDHVHLTSNIVCLHSMRIHVLFGCRQADLSVKAFAYHH